MSHQIMTTTGYILRVNPDGEQSLRALIATIDQGLVVVSVQSGAGLLSKHRPHLYPGAHVVIDMVRGYRGWILTGIRSADNFPVHIAFGAYSNRIGSWALHYLGIEIEIHGELYDLCHQVVQILRSHADQPFNREALSLWILESLFSLGGYREEPLSWAESIVEGEGLSVRRETIRSIIDSSHLGRKKKTASYRL